jgi:hypothetical protein
MLRRSFGARSLQQFWQYWNPIWGYYLGRYIYRPLARSLPPALARLLTFLVSGAIHDVAGTVLTLRPLFFFTPWFTLIAVGIELSRRAGLDLAPLSFWQRALAHGAFIGGTFYLTRLGLQGFLT